MLLDNFFLNNPVNSYLPLIDSPGPFPDFTMEFSEPDRDKSFRLIELEPDDEIDYKMIVIDPSDTSDLKMISDNK